MSISPTRNAPFQPQPLYLPIPCLSCLPLSPPAKPSIVIPVLYDVPHFQAPMSLSSLEEGPILELIMVTGLHVLDTLQIKCTYFLF